MIEMIVRDGRIGRDPNIDHEELLRFECSIPLSVGARFHLPTGELVEVIGGQERWGADVAQQVLYVGNVFDPA